METKKPNLLLLSEVFANLRPLRFGSDRRACAVHLQLCFLAFQDLFGLTLPCGVFLAGWLLPHQPGTALARSVTAVLALLREAPRARLFSTRTMQLALMPSTIICSRSACCLRLLHATDECTRQMQPSERPDYPHAWKPHSNCSSSRACHHHAFCVCPSAAPGCAERPLPAAPAVGPLSSESTLPTL